MVLSLLSGVFYPETGGVSIPGVFPPPGLLCYL